MSFVIYLSIFRRKAETLSVRPSVIKLFEAFLKLKFHYKIVIIRYLQKVFYLSHPFLGIILLEILTEREKVVSLASTNQPLGTLIRLCCIYIGLVLLLQRANIHFNVYAAPYIVCALFIMIQHSQEYFPNNIYNNDLFMIDYFSS